MFGLLRMVSNTIEGAAQTTLGAAKAVVGVVAIPLDDGAIFDDAAKNVRDGVRKIGSDK